MATELTAVLFALRREAQPFLRRANRRRRLVAPCPAWSDGHSLVVMQTGMGAAATRRALDWLLATHRPRRIISAGFCGSLVAELSVGMVIRPSAIRKEDDSPIFLANASGEGNVILVSVDDPILDRSSREQLRERTGAHLVDMESATVALRGSAAGIAVSSLRVVTDDLHSPLPAELPSVVDGERVRLLPLLGALACRPGLAIDLIRLARHSRDAAAALAAALGDLLNAAYLPEGVARGSGWK